MTKELLYTGITRANNEELPEARAKTIKTEDHQAKVVIVSSKAVLEATLNRKTIRDSGLRVMLAQIFCFVEIAKSNLKRLFVHICG